LSFQTLLLHRSRPMYRLFTKRTANKKAVLSQKWPRDAPYINRLEKISSDIIGVMAFDSSLPKISNVPLGVGGWPLDYDERRCWANCPCISFQDFLILIHQRHRRTDRQTDDMQSQGRALHYSTSRSKNESKKTRTWVFWYRQSGVHWSCYVLLFTDVVN